MTDKQYRKMTQEEYDLVLKNLYKREREKNPSKPFSIALSEFLDDETVRYTVVFFEEAPFKG